MYKLFIVLLLFAQPAQPPAVKEVIVKTHVVAAPQTLKTDSSKIAVRKLNSAELKKLQDDPAFNYHVDTAKGDSWWTRFWRWVWHTIENWFGSSEKSSQTRSASPIFQFIFFAVVVGLIAWVIIKAIGLSNIFSRKAAEVPLPNSEWLENIHQITFDEEIEKAVAQRNYRLAVRLLYLRCLKQLNDARLIDWQIEKTNSAYVNELSGTEQKQSFRVLTRQFEYVWYGDFPVDGASFQSINALFADFKKMLS